MSLTTATQRRRRLGGSVPAVWPFGALGDLTITSGNTVSLTQGSQYDYRNITIDAGGILQFTTGDGSTPSVLGWSGVFTNNGTVIAKFGENAGGTFGTTAPDGYVFSYTTTQSSGSNGGDNGGGGDTWGFGVVDGGGGGGGGNAVSGFADNADVLGNGGNGGSGTPATYAGALGGQIYNSNGFDGSPASGTITVVTGPGGGGGAKGRHGGGLYLKGGPGSTTAGVGSVTASGEAGGAGGAGGNSTNLKVSGTRNSYGGGGAGGAGGGCGGKIVARFKGVIPLWTFTASGGSGGTGGTGGIAVGTGIRINGATGNDGAPGSIGSTDIAAY